MNAALSTWAVAVTAAVLLSAMVGALLPETSIKKYVLVGLGVIVTTIILSPLISLLAGTDVEREMRDVLKSVESAQRYEYDSSLYKDYIYKLYEAYIEGE